MIEPLKPLEPIPITNGVIGIKIDPSAKYIVFMDRNQVDVDTFLTQPDNPLPPGTPVYLVDDVERAAIIYQIMDAADHPNLPIKSPIYKATHDGH